MNPTRRACAPGPGHTAPRPENVTDADWSRAFKTQFRPNMAEQREVLDRNPEGASTHGLWRDVEFLRNVYDLNKDNKDTQFADYHGHGWNSRAILKRDRRGDLLDAGGDMRDLPAPTPRISSRLTIRRNGARPGKASSSNRAPTIPASRST